MKKFFLIILLIMFLTAGSSSASENVLLFRFRSTGVDEQLLDAVDQVFGDALTASGVYSPVRAYEVVGNVQCYTPLCASGFAEDAGYRKALIGSLTRFGNKIIVNISLVEAGSSEVLHTAEGSSKTVEDLDIVLKRMARSISSGKTVEDTAEVGMITERDMEAGRRRSSFTTKGLRAGFLLPVGDSYGIAERLTSVDFVVQHDMLDYFLSGKTGVKWSSGAWGFTWLHTRIGRYFSRGDFSPFISAGLGLESLKIEYEELENGRRSEYSDSKTGFILSAGGGIALFRTYDFQFQLDLDYYIVLEKMEILGEEKEFPQGVMLTFCLKH
ncbi:MAG: hypothetical protein GF417_12060 [Candidatus Latescibacteria bacterium]|nr:hypothetical protein [bacterium]MBD3425161.1 hypothetical protein [Candidatus Latescibacterota bacterium]